MPGDGVYLVAIAWLVYDISNKPGALAIVGFAWTLPQVAGLLLAGVLSDRFERRRLLILADLIRFAAIGTIAGLVYADAAELWHLIVLVIFYGLGQALFQPRLPRSSLRSSRARSCCRRTRCASCWSRWECASSGQRWEVLIAVFGVGTAFLIERAHLRGVRPGRHRYRAVGRRCARHRLDVARPRRGLRPSAPTWL